MEYEGDQRLSNSEQDRTGAPRSVRSITVVGSSGPRMVKPVIYALAGTLFFQPLDPVKE